MKPTSRLQGFRQILHSIRFRLALWFVFILALILAAFSTLIYLTQLHEMQTETVGLLENKLEATLYLLRRGGPVALENAALQGGDDGGHQAVLTTSDILLLFQTDGTPIQTWGKISQAEIVQLAQKYIDQPGQRILFARATINGLSDDYSFMISPLVAEDQLSGFILIGSPFDPRGRMLGLLLTLLLGSLGTLVVALAGGFWLADRAMRPVQTITQAARQISESDLSRRMNLHQPDEIGQLADTFDAMLARLEAAFERQRQFTADASHELRTPLTIVNLEASRALSAPRSPKEYQRALGVIHSENELMGHLVNDLLTLARMDAGRELLQMEPLDLSDLALEVVERLEPLAARQKVQLTTGELPEVLIHGDRKALIQMLTNLVENAIKYTAQNDPPKERLILVETGAHPARSLGWARVTDTGPGIPSDHLPHLFDRFYRVDEARTADVSSPNGSGLGLAIVEGLAHLHGGQIEVQSEAGDGSSFEITLPLQADGNS